MTDMHREAFEKWAIDRGWRVLRINQDIPGAVEYDETYVSCAWLGFQAAMRYRDEQEKGDE